MNDLNGKVALVTGGARDIGRAVCIKLAAHGASVVVNYKSSAAAAAETIRTINSHGGQAVAVHADVTRLNEIEELVQQTLKTFGSKIHILVNNAGGLIARKKIHEMDIDYWDTVMAVNLKSVFLVTRTVLPHMVSGGGIVNLSSLAARDGGGGGALAYSTSKGGVMTFTRALAKELKPRKIRVNCVSPGLIATTFHDIFTSRRIRQKVAANTLAEREGTAEDVANAIYFLASDMSSYINGESLEINGGLYFV